MSKAKDLLTVSILSYGEELGKEMLGKWIEKQKDKKKNKDKEKEPEVKETPAQTQEQTVVNEAPVMQQAQQAEMPETNSAPVQYEENAAEPAMVETQQAEMPVTNSNPVQYEEKAEEQVKQEKQELVTPESKAKEQYSGLFGLFTDMLGKEGEDNSSDDVLAQMFMAAMASWMGVDVFKERLDEKESQLQKQLEEERQARLAAEKALAEERAAKEPVQQTAAPERLKLSDTLEVSAPHIDVQVRDLNLKDIHIAKAPSLKTELNVVAEKPDLSKIKVKSSAELEFDKLAAGKEQMTLADLEKAGVNLKTDLQPTLKALAKDNPEKVSELAPQGLGDKDKPVSKELAVALIGRKQQRDAIIARQKGNDLFK